MGFLETNMEESSSAHGLERLCLRDFRNYEFAEIEPSQGLNLVFGANAQGKTSLVEAVSLVSTGRLLRPGRDTTAIRNGVENAEVLGTLSGVGTTVGIHLTRGGRKRAELNGMTLPRASDVIGRLPSVSFSAMDLVIARGEPADRRQFLDFELAQLFPSYLRSLAVYKRSLEHRNALLRRAQEQPVEDEAFESWETQLATSGAAIRAVRADWVSKLSEDASLAHAALGAGERLSLDYLPKEMSDSMDQLLSAFSGSRRIDVARGTTSVGPHRDELLVSVEGQEARMFGSQGQQRTAVIAIKLGVVASLVRETHTQPVLLLDDVFSDLDKDRRECLIELTLGNGGQVFLTCTEADQAGRRLVEQARLFRVDSGTVVAQ